MNIYFLLFLVSLAAAAENIEKVIYLDAGAIVDFHPLARHRGFFENDLRTYCYRGSEKTLGRLFESVDLQLEIDSDDYTQYEGLNPSEVREHYDEQRSLFSFNLFTQKRSRLPLSPFVQQCIGIETMQPYRIRLQQLRVDFWRVIQLFSAVILFMYAGQLSSNSLFYYITGVLLGICSSFMLLIWLASKLMPRRPMMYGMLIGGWTIGIYIIQMLWDNLQVIVVTYRVYVFWYILVTSVLSFFLCYRLGPPKNKRSKNIVKWVLQLIALLLIYLSSHFEEASVAIIILTVVAYYFPRSLLYKIRAWYSRRFPPKQRLLTSEEFIEEGARETAKALEDLRAYASSPECKSWKVMSKLRDPMRFAAFVEGASHLRDEEILHFESANCEDELDESDLSIDEEDEEQILRHENNHSYMPQCRQQNSRINRRISVATRDDFSEDDDDIDTNQHIMDVNENKYGRRRSNRDTSLEFEMANRQNISNHRNYVNNSGMKNYRASPSASRSLTQSTRIISSSHRDSDQSIKERRFAESNKRHLARQIDDKSDFSD